jgi:hypothetical protein
MLSGAEHFAACGRGSRRAGRSVYCKIADWLLQNSVLEQHESVGKVAGIYFS